MSDVASEVRTPEAAADAAAQTPVRALPDPTDRPIPIWPEGVLAAAACVTLAVICFRHRTWLQRKVEEGQRALAEFQRHGGVEDLTQVAKQAADFLKG
jgi:cytoskeletal protein RodZ